MYFTLFFFIFKIKVTFTNETTGEYQYFEVNFKSIRNKSLDLIKMQTPIRKPITHTLILENPLSIPVNFQMSTNISEVQCPNQLQIPANCEVSSSIVNRTRMGIIECI